jgi:hypothetical protein
MGPSEHNHIDNIKKMAKMTQGCKYVLDWQIVNRCADSYILDLAYNLMHPQAAIDTSMNADTAFHGISHLGAIRTICVTAGYKHKIFQSQDISCGIHSWCKVAISLS